jgi:hypothetical protein
MNQGLLMKNTENIIHYSSWIDDSDLWLKGAMTRVAECAVTRFRESRSGGNDVIVKLSLLNKLVVKCHDL